MSDIIFTAYFEPQPAEASWYSHVLSQFWHYGLRYHPYPGEDAERLQARTWKEELQTHPQYLYLGESQPCRDSLEQWLEQVPLYVQGSLSAYDRWVHILLTLKPNAQGPSQAMHPLEKLGKIEMSYDAGHFHMEGPSSSDPVPLFLQVWYAILHWSNVCCRIVQPLYACGFYENDGPAEGFWHDQGEHDYIEQPLLQGKLPDLAAQIKRPMIQYISPQFMESWGVSALLKHPNAWNQNMPDGGVMHVRPAFPFHYGLGLAYNYLNLAREADNKEGLDEVSDQLYTTSGELLKLYEKEVD
jgi:hypothetical protein